MKYYPVIKKDEVLIHTYIFFYRYQKQTNGYQRGNMEWGGINQEFGINIYILLYLK